MQPARSLSEELRSKGNSSFRSVEPGLPPVVKKSRLNAAFSNYEAAFQVATLDKERASAMKNKAATADKLAQEEEDAASAFHFQATAVVCYAAAADFGLACMKEDWLSRCLTLSYEGYNQVFDLEDLSVKDRLRRFHCFHNFMDYRAIGRSGLDIFEYITDTIHNYVVDALDDNDYGLALECIAEASRFLHNGLDAAARLHDSSMLANFQEKQRDIFLFQCTCESVQMRNSGDMLLQSALAGSENLNMDGIWAAVDFYKQAAVLTKEEDTENEAIALSKLGSVFKKVLKDDPRAQPYFSRAMHLASSLWPKLFDHCDWYRECVAALAQYQAEAVAHDEAKTAAARAPYLEELREELEALETAAKMGAHKLLKHVYETFPPKNPGHVMSAEPNSENTKSLLLIAIKHYHPDKNRQMKYDEKWCVLCEEITKQLNIKYTMFK